MGAVTVELALANLLYNFDWEMPQGLKAEDIDMNVLHAGSQHAQEKRFMPST